MSLKKIKLAATDLDGTFLKNDRSISLKNIEALKKLGEEGIVRVVATGRNLLKVMEVIPESVPFDFIVYSSGAGIYNWKDKTHLFHKNLSSDSSGSLIDFFRKKDYSFFMFDEAPENHRLWYHRGTRKCEEFDRYFNFHNSFSEQLPTNGELEKGLCQFMLIIPEDEDKFAALKYEIEDFCSEARVIRSSSPVTRGYIWVEVFHRDVSKGNGVGHLSGLLGIKQSETLGVGNDYNDIDLLDYTSHSFITENAPSRIKTMYNVVPSNENDAFAYIAELVLE